MDSLVLGLFFHGLIAFAPDGPNGMDAYLVKHANHSPLLMFEMTKASLCPTSSREELRRTVNPPMLCFDSGEYVKAETSWCVCYVGGNAAGNVKVSFQPSTVGPTRPVDDGPDIIKPQSATGSADFSWLVRMANIQDGVRVPIRNFSDIRSRVGARMNFKWLSERSCHLDQFVTNEACELNPEEDCEFKVHPFRFVDSAGDVARHRQALSEYASFELRLPFRPVSLVLEHEAKPELRARDLRVDLGCGVTECPDLLVANVALFGSGGHFSVYYDLAQGTPKRRTPYRLVEADSLTVEGRQLFTCFNDPLRRLKSFIRAHVAADQLSTSAAGIIPAGVTPDIIQVFIDAIIRAAETRIICPMAMFDRQP